MCVDEPFILTADYREEPAGEYLKRGAPINGAKPHRRPLLSRVATRQNGVAVCRARCQIARRGAEHSDSQRGKGEGGCAESWQSWISINLACRLAATEEAAGLIAVTALLALAAVDVMEGVGN